MGAGIRAVDRDLHAFGVETRETVGGRVVDAQAVGLNLEGRPSARQGFKDGPGMRDGERLPASERGVRNTGLDDLRGESQSLALR